MIRYNAYRGCPTPASSLPAVRADPVANRRPGARLPGGSGLKLYLWLFDCAKRGLPAPRNKDIAEHFGAASMATGARLVATLESMGLIEVSRKRSSRKIFVRELQRWTA